MKNALRASEKWPDVTDRGWPDRFEIDINGQAVAAGLVRRIYRPKGQSEAEGRPLAPFTLIWFRLESPPAKRGLNILGFRLTETEKTPLEETETITIEEMDITVMPRPLQR